MTLHSLNCPCRSWAGAETFVLAGGSFGGFLALSYALTFPDRLSALILRDTWACGPRGTLRALATILTSTRIKPDVDRQVRLWSGTLRDNDDFENAISEIMTIYTPNNKISESASFEGVDGNSNIHYETQNAAFSVHQPQFDVRSRLSKITTPTLVVVGRHDVICPVEDSLEISKNIANSELVIFENSGHNPPADEPERFQATVFQFLDRLLF